jgi:hypothetical protein
LSGISNGVQVRSAPTVTFVLAFLALANFVIGIRISLQLMK